jgi:hypothetical protein
LWGKPGVLIAGATGLLEDRIAAPLAAFDQQYITISIMFVKWLIKIFIEPILSLKFDFHGYAEILGGF